MNNISKPRFLISVFLISVITAIVSLNSDISESFFLDLQTFLSKYLGWMIIILANGFVIFSIFLIFTKYKDIKLGGSEAKPTYSYVNWIAMLFSAGLGIGLAAAGGAIGQGKTMDAALNAIGRNPGAAGQIQTPMIIGLALIESLVIYALAITFLLQSKI